MNVLTVFFSRTETTEQVMGTALSSLVRCGCHPHVERIRPEVDLPFPLWLAQSFVPGARAPIHPLQCDPAEFDICLLGLPKWTFACPPVNSFLEEYGQALPPTAVLLTCGGWDQERYMEELEQRLRALGISVLPGLIVRRRNVGSDENDRQIDEFVVRVISSVAETLPRTDDSHA